MIKKFKSIRIDLDKVIYEIDGVDASKDRIFELKLVFKHGGWTLVTKRTTDSGDQTEKFKGSI